MENDQTPAKDVFGLQQNSGSAVEPTLTMTTSYALTSFEVQYWDGSSWATVSGGSVSGNDKVWKKFSFSSLTTNKIRVNVTSVSGDNHTQVVEVEAWGPATESGSSSAANINYLVTDQLGTPRMIFDQSGSLAATKRHDYAPFGEELFDGARTTAMGYAANDTTRQQFTSKERDNETGLDYFGARYFASTQGRFTSVDPARIKLKQLLDPQDLNRYSYVANNPLAFVDPDGEEKIKIIIRSFIPDKTTWGGYHGDGHKVGEKIKAKDGFRIRQTMIVETSPSRNRGSVIVGSQNETGVSVGPNYNPRVPVPAGTTGAAQATCDTCQMTAVRTENKGVSVNFSANESNPLAPPGSSISYNLNVTVDPSNAQGPNGVVVTLDGQHTKFPAFDVTVERMDVQNNTPVTVYGYDPNNNGSTPLSLLPGAPKQQVTEAQTLTTIPEKKKKENQ
ncbi:MAG TPA: RHS repeat-associated core domain-containing protein [Pyrinomonadaceae bacterium]|nr:RHS repeat-associated core domain-containing protein [Pyrinomonadaceae bacterium]